MLTTIKSYQEKKATSLMSLVKSDDGTLVFFKKNFDAETGEEKSPETVKTMTKQEILDKVAEMQADIDSLNKFLTDESL